MEVIIDLSTRIFISPWGEIYLEHFLKYLGKFYLASLNMQEKLKSQASHISVLSPLTWRRRNKNITSICTSSFSYVFVFLEWVSIFDFDNLASILKLDFFNFSRHLHHVLLILWRIYSNLSYLRQCLKQTIFWDGISKQPIRASTWEISFLETQVISQLFL